MPKTGKHPSPVLSPDVRARMDAAADGAPLKVLLKYGPGVLPTEARDAHEALGLEVKIEWPPTLTVTGDKAALERALGHELTVGLVMNLQEYERYLSPTSAQRERLRRRPAAASPGR